jgi:hypothetical protein
MNIMLCTLPQKPEKVTGESCAVHWLIEKFNKNERVSNYTVQMQLPIFSKNRFNRYYTPASCERYFRFVREKNLLANHGLKLVEVPPEDRTSSWDQWELKPIDKIKVVA